MWKWALAAVAVLGIGFAAMGAAEEEEGEPNPPGNTFLVDEGEMSVRSSTFAFRVWQTPEGFLGELEIDVGWVATETSATLEEAIMRLRVMAEDLAPGRAGEGDVDIASEVAVKKARIIVSKAKSMDIITGIPVDIQRPIANDICKGKKGIDVYAPFGLDGFNFDDVNRHPSWLPFWDLCIGYIKPGTYTGIPAGFYVVIWRPGDEDRKAVIGPYDSWVMVPGGRPEVDVERGIRYLLTQDFEDVYAATHE